MIRRGINWPHLVGFDVRGYLYQKVETASTMMVCLLTSSSSYTVTWEATCMPQNTTDHSPIHLWPPDTRERMHRTSIYACVVCVWAATRPNTWFTPAHPISGHPIHVQPIWINTRVSDPTSRMSRWRNGLAHWTSNSKVAGSSPARDVIFFTSLFSHVRHLEHFNMWKRLVYKWRSSGLFSSRNYCCKRERNEVFNASLYLKAKPLQVNQVHLPCKSSACYLNHRQLHPRSCIRDGAFVLPFRCSLQEHLSIARISWLKPANMKLPARFDIISCIDPSKLENYGEEAAISLDYETQTCEGILCSSVLKKRRAKMNKHKYRKRRKKFKFLRRALGKWILVINFTEIMCTWTCLFIYTYFEEKKNWRPAIYIYIKN